MVKRTKAKKKKRRCKFSVADSSGTFLEGSKVPAWKSLLFFKIWLDRTFSLRKSLEGTALSDYCLAALLKFCYNVTSSWLERKKPVGGDGAIVEVGETRFVRINRSKKVFQEIWLIGGIDEKSKEAFIVALDDEDERSFEGLLPIIQRYVSPGSTIVSKISRHFGRLVEEGYTFRPVKHTKKSAETGLTDNIEQLWKDLNGWSRRRCSTKQCVQQYVSRYLFVRENNSNCFDAFLAEVARLYPHTLSDSKAACNTSP